MKLKMFGALLVASLMSPIVMKAAAADVIKEPEWGPVEEVESLMAKRAGEMPCEEVVVYCASCITSMSVGGKRPRYLLDLLFGEKTDIFMLGAETWNSKLTSFRIRNAKQQTSQ